MQSPPLALALLLLAFTTAPAATAQDRTSATLEPSRSLQPPPGGAAADGLSVVLQARRLSARPDAASVAEGDVELRRGGLVIRADRLEYRTAQDIARAQGNVRVQVGGARFSGPEIELQVQRTEGFFLDPTFDLPLIGAGGRASRVDFLGPKNSTAIDARYTSCPRDGPAEPAWVLSTSRVSFDLERNIGEAENAVLRFYGVPILAAPGLSFALGDTRKSGWLPPSINIDNRSGLELSVPYYWNIAPNRDATLAPRLITRRGVALDSEFRYLEPRFEGRVQVDWLPDDRVARRGREGVQWFHEGTLGSTTRYAIDLTRVSDDDWWKDFPNTTRSFTPRLLPQRAGVERRIRFGEAAELSVYMRALRWQVLQSADSSIASPYQRAPQIGTLIRGQAGGWTFAAETELNRFTLPSGEAARAGRLPGERAHLLARVAYPVREGGMWLVPQLALNAAAYRTGGTEAERAGAPRRDSRAIPSLSVDAGFELERQTTAFGRALHQTLEPRLLYLNTPFREQASLPNYDAAAKDFNIVSLFSDNPFSGIDRVADAHQFTAGFTTRLVDVDSGAEALRLGLVQRWLLRDQRVAPQADGSPDGPPLTQRFSDALLVGSTSVFPGWNLDAAVQYSPEISRSVRSVLAARYSPGPFRTVGATYRFARGLSEQVELGWQWPVWRSAPSGSGCSGSWYSVGRVNYSMKDSRVTDSVLGAEYDAGCWIGRIVAERLSTGRSEATTRLLLQLELVGLSRLGSNPLKVLKDNIPGYRLLRDERGSRPAADEWQPVP
jgi:LPS-assembly protein